MADIPTIEPFQFIRSTAFSERVQLANKLNEVIDAVNSIGDLPDLETQITEINTKISELEESIGNTDTSLADLENQVNGLISEVNTTIKQAISALESDVEGIDTRLTTAEGTISEHGTEIDGLLKEVIDSVEMSSNPHGTIQVQINHVDGSNDISAPIDLGLVEEGGIVLQSGTTDRSFKLIVTLTDGTSWQTNDFVIPEGGGTDVSVTNISIAQGTSSNMIQVKIGLSDGSTISSNDWTVVTPSEFSALGTRVTTAEGKITAQEGEISDLETRVQAIEDSPGFTLQPATATTLGGVKIGSGITVQSDGTIAVDMKKINTAAVASTVMFTVDASKVTLHTDSIAGSEFTEDIPQASQGGAGTIDQASYAKIAATEAKVNALAPTVTVNEEVDPPTITVNVNGKSSTANLPSTSSLNVLIYELQNSGVNETPGPLQRDSVTTTNIYKEDRRTHLCGITLDEKSIIDYRTRATTSTPFIDAGYDTIQRNFSATYTVDVNSSMYHCITNNCKKFPNGNYTVEGGWVTDANEYYSCGPVSFSVNDGSVTVPTQNVSLYANTSAANLISMRPLPSTFKKV